MKVHPLSNFWFSDVVNLHHYTEEDGDEDEGALAPAPSPASEPSAAAGLGRAVATRGRAPSAAVDVEHTRVGTRVEPAFFFNLLKPRRDVRALFKFLL